MYSNTYNNGNAFYPLFTGEKKKDDNLLRNKSSESSYIPEDTLPLSIHSDGQQNVSLYGVNNDTDNVIKNGTAGGTLVAQPIAGVNNLYNDKTNSRPKLYPTSEQGLDNVITSYYNNTIKGIYNKNRNESKNKGRDIYRQYISVPGADPDIAQREMMRVDNPMNDIKRTFDQIDVEELAAAVAPFVGDGDVGKYLNEKVVPGLYSRMLDEAINEDIPNSSSEYILRSAIDNSLIGKVSKTGLAAKTGDNDFASLQSEALNRYNPGRMEQFAANVGSLLIDTPVFSALGSMASSVVGRAASLYTDKLTQSIYLARAGEGVTKKVAGDAAKRIVTQRLSSKIAQGAAVQGFTLGTYDVANSVVEDLLYTSSVNSGKALKSLARGALTGTALSVVGTPLREIARQTSGLKRAYASSKVLCAESAVFAGVSETEKILSGVEVTPVDFFQDFGESAATLVAMRLAHWRPRGANIKLDKNGEIKKELKLAEPEKMELEELNYNPEEFMSALERELRLPSFGGKGNKAVLEEYKKIIADKNVSLETKSKLAFLVENILLSSKDTILPLDYTVDRNEKGMWRITNYDEWGRKIDTHLFKNTSNLKSHLLLHKGKIRSNRILAFETELTKGFLTANFLRQAGQYVKRTGVNVDDVSSAMYKKVRGEQLTTTEEGIINDLLELSSYNESGMVQELHDIRRGIEKRYGLEKGSLLTKVQEAVFRITPMEDIALDEYERALRKDIEELKSGASQERALEIMNKGLGSEYRGMSNEEVKANETDAYNKMIEERMSVFQNRQPVPMKRSRVTEIPSENRNGKVWSKVASNTAEQVESYKARAEELGEKFGVKLNLITDMRQVQRPDVNNEMDVMRYETQLMAEGWTDGETITVALPNARSVENVEKTILHELVGHQGLLKIFGHHIYDFIEEVYRRGMPEVYEGIKKKSGKYDPVNAYSLVEEYLAELAENVNPTVQERTLLVRIKDCIKDLLIRTKLYTGNNRRMGEAELRELLQKHCEYMMKKTKPHVHRRRVFGDFKSAHYNKESYYDLSKFIEGVQKMIDNGTLLPSAPRFLRNAKGLLYYRLLPPEQQKIIRERLNFTEEDIKKYTY